MMFNTGAAAATTNHNAALATTSAHAVSISGVTARTIAVSPRATRTNGRRRADRAARRPQRIAPGTPASAAVEASTPIKSGPPPNESA